MIWGFFYWLAMDHHSGRKRQVSSGNELAKPFTFNDTASHVKLMEEVADTMGMNRSEFIRWCVDPHIEKLRTGEIKRPAFNLEDKGNDLIKAKNFEHKFEEDLRNASLGRAGDAFNVLREFVKNRFGTDDSLTKDFPEVLEKLKTYQLTGRELFNRSHVLSFILYGNAVLKRRAIQKEIDDYFLGAGTAPVEDKGAASSPLVEKALVA